MRGLGIRDLCLAVAAAGAVGFAAGASASSATQIVTDEAAGIVRVMVRGQEMVRIDDSGMHVRRNLEYGGTITDVGEQAFDASHEEGATGATRGRAP